MTERKRASLDLSGFQPRREVPAPIPPETQVIAERAGFTTRHATPAEAPAAPNSARELFRVPVEVPREVRAWLKAEAVRRDSTVRAVILEGLRLQGAPVAEVDLADRRRRDS